ncbi:MAG: TetR/AcrR family transcriptional regulator [Myxococcota bacterium]
MARPVDPALHDARRSEILDAAARLVGERGYTRVSLQDVLDAVGMSKGSFYHYFRSKQDIAEALIERAVAPVEEGLRALVADRALTGSEKLQRHFRGVDAWKREGGRQAVALAVAAGGDEDLLLHHRLYVAGQERFAPLFAQIVAQGVREGDFAVEDPEEAARIVLCLRHDLGRAVVSRLDDPAYVARAALATAAAIERVLGAAPDAIVGPTRAALGQRG